MKKFNPKEIYYEKDVLSYDLGKFLKEKYHNIPWTEIDNHNNFQSLEINQIVNLQK